jgi:spermidine/putrescine transport system ATP-binding protein
MTQGAGGSVELLNLSQHYGAVRAVDDISINIEAGEFVSLLGPSGCGKTTTLRMIGGFEIPQSGTVRIDGVDHTNTPPHKRPVNTVFQQYALFPHMSVANNVAYGLRAQHVSKQSIQTRVTEALDLVQMRAHARKKPQQLSGGQQQRVAVARALVLRPKVLLLDEPLAALDRKLREEMHIELKLLHREVGITFILVTHDQEEALSLSDRVAVMNLGKVEQIASPSELYDTPNTAFVASFVGSQNFISVERVGPDRVQLHGRTAGFGRDTATGPTPQLAVRAENVGVGLSEPSPDLAAVHGELIGASILGNQVRYVVQLLDGTEIQSRSPRSAELFSLGTSVWCSWRHEHGQLFDSPPKETPAAASA